MRSFLFRSGRRHAKPDETETASVEDLDSILRSARPEPSPLADAATEGMLAAAFRGLPQHTGQARRAPVLTGLALAAVAILLTMFPVMQQIGRHPDRMTVAMETGGRSKAAEPIGSERIIRLKPQTVAPSVRGRGPVRRPGPSARIAQAGRRRGHHVTQYAATRPIASKLRSARTAPESAVAAAEPPIASPSLVVIVTEGAQTALKVEIEASASHADGFATAEAYLPVGPGGGVLTRCTVRDDPSDENICTACYGTAIGQPVAIVETTSVRCAADTADQPKENDSDTP